jgi:hypothetical protein
MFLRRLGQEAINLCPGGHHCSQVLETVDGDFAAVGSLITEEAIKAMPPGPGIGPTEGVVRVPRAVMIAAAIDILKAA